LRHGPAFGSRTVAPCHEEIRADVVVRATKVCGDVRGLGVQLRVFRTPLKYRNVCVLERTWKRARFC